MFNLNAQLQADTISIGSMELCEVLLAKDANYPWLILVPKREGMTEIYQLSDAEQLLLMQETSFVARQMETHFLAHKMNIAALGNVVSQLHIHVVARFDNDAAWPAPIWGAVAAKGYEADELDATVNSVRALLYGQLQP